MNFDLNEDQREIKRTAREFLAARYTPEKIRAIALDGEPDPHWDEIVELGWPDIAEYGIVELAVVAEELGYSLAPTPLAAHWAAKLLHPDLEGRGTVAMWDGEDGAKIAVPNADVADVIVVKDGERVLAVQRCHGRAGARAGHHAPAVHGPLRGRRGVGEATSRAPGTRSRSWPPPSPSASPRA